MSEQKFKLSGDQNTLIIENGQLAGEYVAKKQYGCRGCAFWKNNANCEIGTVHTCAYSNRKDYHSIVWIKKETEPKQDDKKAVAVFYDEKILAIRHSNKHNGNYEAKESHGCDGCFFKGETAGCTFNVAILGNQKCSPYYRDDDTSIIWIKKETEMTKAPAPAPTAERFSRDAILARLQHRHFVLIV